MLCVLESRLHASDTKPEVNLKKVSPVSLGAFFGFFSPQNIWKTSVSHYYFWSIIQVYPKFHLPFDCHLLDVLLISLKFLCCPYISCADGWTCLYLLVASHIHKNKQIFLNLFLTQGCTKKIEDLLLRCEPTFQVLTLPSLFTGESPQRRTPWIDHMGRNGMTRSSPLPLRLHCLPSTAILLSPAPAPLWPSTHTLRECMGKVIQWHWTFRILYCPNLTHLHLRISQPVSDPQTEKTLHSLLSIPRKVSPRKLQLMEQNRLRKQSLQHTADSRRNHTQVLPDRLNASLKALNSITIFCQVNHHISLTCLPSRLLLQKLSWKLTV